jgi:hypothetical protein
MSSVHHLCIVNERKYPIEKPKKPSPKNHQIQSRRKAEYPDPNEKPDPIQKKSQQSSYHPKNRITNPDLREAKETMSEKPKHPFLIIKILYLRKQLYSIVPSKKRF